MTEGVVEGVAQRVVEDVAEGVVEGVGQGVVEDVAEGVVETGWESRRQRRERLDRRELEMLGEMLGPECGPFRFEGRERVRGPHPLLKGLGVGEFLAQAILKVRGKDGRLHPLRANAVQRAFERRRRTGNIVLKARQMGMTTWVSGRLLLKTICQPGTLTLQVAHTQDAAEEILGIVHRMVEHLPPGLKAGALKTAKRNVRQIVFPEIDSEFRVESAADRNAGRGMTFQNLHCSEVGRWGESGSDEAADVLAGLRAGLVPGGEQILESTPDGAHGCFYEEWHRAEQWGAGGMVKHFFPWWLEAGYRAMAVDPGSLSEQELELIARPDVGLDLEQIGYRRGLLAGLRGLARQEFAEDAESCFRVSGEPYFEMEFVEKRLAQLVDGRGDGLIRRDRGGMEVWLPPLYGKLYVVAVDPAGGGSAGDYSAIQVLDRETGMQCAEFAGHVGNFELMELARNIAWDYNTAWLAVERNNHGEGLLWLLQDKGYREIFRGADGKPGYLTTAASKPQMLARMSAILAQSGELFSSRKLLVECRSFVRLKSGSVGARPGSHDDRVMAMAVGLAAREELLGRRQGTGSRD